ncbi:MAG: ABC transporter ATP-binding protein, partial [bacterium]|nr:ABC transporter ATP-binding protein [bacterium]
MDKTNRADTDDSIGFSTVTRYLSKYRRYLILGGFAVLATNLLSLYAPYLTKEVFDLLEAGAETSQIMRLALAILGLALGAAVFRFLMRRTIIWMSRFIEYDLRSDLMAHLLKLSSSFYHRNRTGDIMARMTNDLEAIRQMVGPGVMYLSDAFLKLLISFSVMIYLSPSLTLYAAIPLVILPIAVNLIANQLHKRSMKIQEQFSQLTATAQENLSGIRVVKAYRQEEEEISNFSQHSSKYIRLNMSLVKLQGIFMPVMRLTASLSYLSVFFFGGMAVMRDEISLGTMVAFFGYLSIILWPVIALGWVMSLYQRGTASLKRVNGIFATSPDTDARTENVHSAEMKGHVEFRNLTFAYNGDSVLSNINLEIAPGQSIGIIGATGSGKTSLISILPRLYPVQPGQLFIDGVDINDWDLQALRRQIGIATQEPFLFSDTLRNNIAFGLDTSDDASVEAAATSAALYKDVDSFPNRFDTLVGERGITLSGGQKQRTSIARAIITNPAILILDDATSAVDTETEHEINDRISEVLTGRTSIIISHRISAVKEADLIIYLEEGKIKEQGRHEELISADGEYAQ